MAYKEPFAVQWLRMEFYKGGNALFWVNDGTSQFAVYGCIEARGFSAERVIWDDNDFGYGPAEKAVAWSPCRPPPVWAGQH